MSIERKMIRSGIGSDSTDQIICEARGITPAQLAERRSQGAYTRNGSRTPVTVPRTVETRSPDDRHAENVAVAERLQRSNSEILHAELSSARTKPERREAVRRFEQSQVETPETPSVPEYRPVLVNSDGLLVPNPLNPSAPVAAPAVLVDENPFKQRLYADKKCSVRRCRDAVQWRVMKGSEWLSGELPVMPGGAVDDSLTAQLEFAEGSVRNRPVGALVEDESTYWCEKHYREQENRRLEARSADAAGLVSKRKTANPYLWSLDPDGVRVDLMADANFLLVFPDGFEMTWEGFRVAELNRWRAHGRKAS